ncbi:MAG: hypothetical protein WCP12_16415 [bacterium]
MNMSESSRNTYSPFWPLCLMALSLIIILGWQLTVGVQQYLGSLRMVDQQAVLATQAAQTESKLQSMMTDLLFLAKTDKEAQAIVAKYRIKLNADKPDTGAPSAEALPTGNATKATPPTRVSGTIK